MLMSHLIILLLRSHAGYVGSYTIMEHYILVPSVCALIELLMSL